LAWTVEFNRTAERQFRNLDFSIQKRIREFIRSRLTEAENPGHSANPWSANLKAFGDTASEITGSSAALKTKIL
jgi:mRNA-degrading endonuclease RelE of RelBE toxin-antitoxin system